MKLVIGGNLILKNLKNYNEKNSCENFMCIFNLNVFLKLNCIFGEQNKMNYCQIEIFGSNFFSDKITCKYILRKLLNYF